jgi:hypothetical protein
VNGAFWGGDSERVYVLRARVASEETQRLRQTLPGNPPRISKEHILSIL